MSWVFDIRGTNGSGKSTVIQNLMKASALVRPLIVKGKIEGYCLDVPDITNDRIYIIGKYETPCGGCDGVSTQNEVCRLVRKYAKLGHVIFEGVIVSTIFTRYYELSKTLDNYIVVQLNTKLDTCIDRIARRREKSGKVYKKDFKKELVADKHTSIARACAKFKQNGIEVMSTSSSAAHKRILERIS